MKILQKHTIANTPSHGLQQNIGDSVAHLLFLYVYKKRELKYLL